MKKNNNRIYCDTMTRPEGFDNVTLYHGFNAFFVTKSYKQCFYDLMNHPEWQICTSTKYLGMIGVVVTGDVLMASSYDLFSGIDEENNNRRFFDKNDMDSIVYNYEDLELHEDDDDENNEIVVQNTKIKAIWVTEDANNKIREIASELSEKTNLPIIEVGLSIFS